MQTPGNTSHSSISSHCVPLILEYPLPHMGSTWHMVQGLPQAAPRDEQHWDFKVAPLMLISHRPSMTVCQQVPLMVSIQMVFVGSKVLSEEHSQMKEPGLFLQTPLMQGLDSHSSMSSQVFRSGLYINPLGQVQTKLPGVFLHCPLSQRRLFSTHSLISTQFFPVISTSYPELQIHL